MVFPSLSVKTPSDLTPDSEETEDLPVQEEEGEEGEGEDSGSGSGSCLMRGLGLGGRKGKWRAWAGGGKKKLGM